MLRQAPLRPELASVCRYVALKRRGRLVRPSDRMPGILGELASGRGLQ